VPDLQKVAVSEKNLDPVRDALSNFASVGNQTVERTCDIAYNGA
jgi:hypothetical protein